MILVDANLLMYAHVEDFDQHVTARMWLDEHLSGTAKVGLPWESLGAYVRLVSNPRIFPTPLRRQTPWRRCATGCRDRPALGEPPGGLTHEHPIS